MAKKEKAHITVEVAKCVPNTWNPNRMSSVKFEKLKTNLLRLIKEIGIGAIPPIVVRPHPERDGDYEIIDGEHRWKVFKQTHQPGIDVFIIDVDDKTARILTANLNYLRGEKDPQKYTDMLGELIGAGMKVSELDGLLVEDDREIMDLLTVYGSTNALKGAVDADLYGRDGVEKTLADDAVFVDLKFHVSVSQAKVIEKEVGRIASVLVGNNTEGRALEFMAVQSGQTPIPPELIEVQPVAPKIKKKPNPLAGKVKKEDHPE